MSEKGSLATVEFYESDHSDKLIGAVCVPAKRLFEDAEVLGKTICKLLHLNSVFTIYYNHEGGIAAHDTIFR